MLSVFADFDVMLTINPLGDYQCCNSTTESAC
jgi:hypothetical protein